MSGGMLWTLYELHVLVTEVRIVIGYKSKCWRLIFNTSKG